MHIKGIQYNQCGNIMSRIDQNLLKDYYGKLKCFTDQYSSYKVGEKHVSCSCLPKFYIFH